MRRFEARESERLRALGGILLASFGARAAAFLIDFLLVVLVVTVIGLPRACAAKQRGEAEHLVVAFEPFHSLLGLIALVAYFGLLTYLGRGQTPGKWLLGIRVVSLVRDRLTLWQSLERALGYAASALEAGFGFVQYFLHPNRQTVHDRIAETVVVAESRKKGATYQVVVS